MKTKTCISLEQETLQKVKAKLGTARFRNKSHLIEEAILKFLEEQDDPSKR